MSNSEDKILKALKEHSNHAFEIQQQKENYLETAKARMIVSYNGGIFSINQEHISYLKSMSDLGYKKIFILDSNNNPIEVDTHDFLQKSVEKHQEALNTYHKLYNQFKRK